MKSVRVMVLMLVAGTFPAFLVQAYGQQEVDPDHYDQATKVVPAQKLNADHKTAASNHHGSRTKLASKHAGVKVHHHQGHASV